MIILILSLDLNLPGERLIELKELSKPELIVVEGNELFVVEDASVYVYSLKDYTLLRKFGQKGNGPAELNPHMRYPLQLQVGGKDILLHSWSKMVFFTRKGEFVREKKFPFIVTQVIPLGDNFAVTKSVINEKGTNAIGVVIFAPNLKELKTVYCRSYPHYQKSGRIDIVPEFVLIRGYENKLLVFDQKQTADFVIHVYGSSGKPLKEIKVDWKKRKMTGEFKEKTWEWVEKDIRFRSLSNEMKRMVTFPDFFPVMKNFQVEDSRIYIHTYQTRGRETEFIVTDFDGKILKNIYLKGADKNTIESAPYTFKDGKYIYLQENQRLEKWELHIENTW